MIDVSKTPKPLFNGSELTKEEKTRFSFLDDIENDPNFFRYMGVVFNLGCFSDDKEHMSFNPDVVFEKYYQYGPSTIYAKKKGDSVICGRDVYLTPRQPRPTKSNSIEVHSSGRELRDYQAAASPGPFIWNAKGKNLRNRNHLSEWIRNQWNYHKSQCKKLNECLSLPSTGDDSTEELCKELEQMEGAMNLLIKLNEDAGLRIKLTP